MSIDFVGSTAVIVARQFNPTIIGQLWLVRNGVVDEHEFRPGCVYTDMAVQVMTEKFDLTVVPQQFQFTPKVPLERQRELVVEKVGRITRTLPHTPFRGLGLNFNWQFTPEGESIAEACRRLFFKPDCPLHESVDFPDARFGGYMSRDVLDVRMQLDVKPVTVGPAGQQTERIQFSFNFHKDLDAERPVVDTIDETLQQWDGARELAFELVHQAAQVSVQ